MGIVYYLKDKKKNDGAGSIAVQVDDENTVFTLTCNCESDVTRISISKKYGIYIVCDVCGNSSDLSDAVNALQDCIAHIE